MDALQDNVAEQHECILVGNKCDMEDQRQVDTKQASDLAADLGLEYFETSAKTGLNIDQVVQRMAEKIIESRKPNKDMVEEPSKEANIRLSKNSKKSKKSKCLL